MSLLVQDEKLTRRVGAVTLVLLLIAIVFVGFIYHRIDWGSRMRVRVYLLSTGGLKEGAPFVVGGRAIGKIESIALAPRGSSKLLGDDEGVAITVALDAEAASRVARDGDVFVTSRGALSSRYLEMGPPPSLAAPAGATSSAPLAPSGGEASDHEPGPTLRDGDELRGKDPPSLDRVLQRTWDNLTTAARFAAEVRPHARALSVELDALRATLLGIAPEILLRDDFVALLDETARTKAALGGDAGIAKMRALAGETEDTIGLARSTIARLRTSADGLAAAIAVLRTRIDSKGVEALDRIDQALKRTRAAIDKVEPLLAQIAAIQQVIERGEGSLLKLARDPEFPEDAKELGRILKRQPWKLFDRPPK